MRLNEWMSWLSSMREGVDPGTNQNTDCPAREALNDLFDKVASSHRWFTREYVDFAFAALCDSAKKNVPVFPLSENAIGKTLGFWMRPLSPFDGFDLILLSLNAGCRCIIRTSETEAILYKGILDLLEHHFPYLKGETEFTDRPFGEVDALVITGEAPTTPQLDYFAQKTLFIDAGSRYLTTAVLTGKETQEELDALAMDLCVFFGRSKYSISKMLVPTGYDFFGLLKSLENYKENGNHSGYFNHYEYRKAAYIVSRQVVIDNGFLILKKETGESQSIGVVVYNEYKKGEIPEFDEQGIKISKAVPEDQKGELVFGNACKRNFELAGEFLQFLNRI